MVLNSESVFASARPHEDSRAICNSNESGDGMVDELRSLDFIPEPDDPRILSAADPNLSGHQEGFRAAVTGWEPDIPPQSPLSNRRFIVGRIPYALLIILLLATTSWWGLDQWLGVAEVQYPDSEWAYEESRIRDLQSVHGLDGTGVNVCIVDTGIDLDHEDLVAVNVVFKDFVSDSQEAIDHGVDHHGSMMAGILVADGHLKGASPGVSLSVAAALGERTGTETVGDTTLVAEAIEWCWNERDADIISLSLGGMQDLNTTAKSEVEQAVEDAMRHGVYVVAAAGNDGGADDDGIVSSPANVPLVIAVGATQEGGELWAASSRDDSTVDGNGDERMDPNLKPEILAPGAGIISTAPGTTYYRSSGTSGATVFIAGTLALILEEYPEMSRSGGSQSSNCIVAMKQALMDSTDPSIGDVEHDGALGYGNLDAVAWFEAVGIQQANAPCGE